MNNQNAFFIEGAANRVLFELVHMSPVAIGTIQTPTLQSSCAIAIGEYAGLYNQGECAIAIGEYAGRTNQGMMGIAIGAGAGSSNQSELALALGVDAGSNNQSSHAIAIGTEAGMFNQSECAIALGADAGRTNQNKYAVAIGCQAGAYNQGTNAIAIGRNAGQTNQSAQSIILNATGSSLSSATKSDAIYISPMNSGTGSNMLYYNTSTKEVTYGPASGGGGGAGSAQLYYNDFLNTIMYPTSTVATAQVTNTISPSSNIPSFPVMPSVVVPGSFNYTIGSGGSFPDLQTALASPLVTNGMNLQILAGTYTIPDTTGIVINKQVGIYGVGTSSVILQTNATSSAPVYAISVRAPNVTLYGITFQHRKTTNTSVEACVSIADTSVSPTGGLNNVIVDSCRIEFMEFAFVIYGDNFRISNCTKLAYVGPTNTTRRTIGLYRSTGNSFIVNNVLEDNGASGSLRFIQLTSTTGLATEVFSGNLVIQGNVQTMGNGLSQFYNQDWFGSTGNGTFSLFLDSNDVNETSAFVVLFIGIVNSGNIFDKIVLTNNSCWNVHGKGIVTVDASSALAFRSIGALPLYVSKNVIGSTSWRTGFAQVTGSFGYIFGYNSTFVSSITASTTVGNALAVVSTANNVGYLSPGTYNLVLYASAPSVTPLTYSFGYTNVNGYGSTFVSLVSGTINITSNVASAYTISLTVPYTVLPYLFSRLRLEISTSGSTNITIYSRSATSGTLQTTIPISNFIPSCSGTQTFGTLAALTADSVSIAFPRIFTGTPSVVSTVNTVTGATNADYVLSSAENALISGCTIRLRNFHTNASATAIGINWTATDNIRAFV